MNCDVCGKDMFDSNMGETVTGCSISLFENKISPHKEIQRIQDMFGRIKFDVCTCCFLKSLGIKEIKK